MLGRAIMSESYRMFADPDPANGADAAQYRQELGAFASITRGIHW
jgi:hypothetical protein